MRADLLIRTILMKKHGKLRPTGKRSKLEDTFSQILQDIGAAEHYEEEKLKYVVPSSNHIYIVDFVLDSGIRIEVKGYLRDVDERQKYELIKEQHPEIDLRFVFADPDKKITRTKMTHGSWAEKVGFKYCSIKDIDIIKEWANAG